MIKYTFENIISRVKSGWLEFFKDEEVELRKKCLQRALGNIEVITPFDPHNQPVRRQRVTMKSQKPVSDDEESD